jgi:hypothetical protein
MVELFIGQVFERTFLDVHFCIHSLHLKFFTYEMHVQIDDIIGNHCKVETEMPGLMVIVATAKYLMQEIVVQPYMTCARCCNSLASGGGGYIYAH